MSEQWERFITSKEFSVHVEPLIYRSWQRSKSYQIDHNNVMHNELLPAPRFQERCQTQEGLIQASMQVLPYLFNFLQGQNYMVLVADNQGYILEALGDPPFLDKTQRVCLAPGASWRENVKGTNAIGTALCEQAPIKVLGWEHFVKENHFLSCWAAPIKNPQGNMMGVLDITGQNSPNNDHLLELVVMGAKMIEQNLQLRQLQHNFQFSRQSIQLVGEMLHEGFIAIDSQAIITEINASGAKLLGRKREEIIGRSASDVFRSPKGWMISNYALNLKLNDPRNADVVSRLQEVVDPAGKTMGVVGVIQPAPITHLDKTEWVGRSPLTQQAFERTTKAASTVSSVLISGESGTGKEVVARHIHRMSTRRNGPFIALNCAAFPHSLIESELFGYAEGAFTGAKRAGQAGKFELANGGTIFLDEIGDMPLDVQVALLRVLQEREILRIGDSKPRKIDVRVISATHRNLATLVSEAMFRLDLYYRLKVVTIDLPPLRQRSEDIQDLVPFFVNKASRNLGKFPPAVADEVFAYLQAHSWPGNIRELENCIEAMVAMSDSTTLTVADLPAELRTNTGLPDQNKPTLLDQQTKLVIVQTLAQTKGKLAPAARLLGIGRSTLYRKMRELGITH